MNKMTKKRWLAAVVVLLIAAGTVWALWPDGRVAKAKALQKELFSPEARNLSPEQRKQKWQELREVQKQLSPEQKKELGAEMRKKRQADMGRYFAMSPKDKEKHLDAIINKQEQMKKAWQGKGGLGKGGPGKAPAGLVQGGPRDKSPKGRDDRRQKFLDSSTPAERAQVHQFMKDLKDRRAKRGLPAFGPPRGGGPMR
jgi:hypothetical protein